MSVSVSVFCETSLSTFYNIQDKGAHLSKKRESNFLLVKRINAKGKVAFPKLGSSVFLLVFANTPSNLKL